MSWMLRGSLALLALRLGGGCEAPTDECPQDDPIPPPTDPGALGGGLDGFESPYLGHTGSWDGRGGGLGGSSKEPDMDVEVSMGLRWTFMPVYWNKMEPDGPVDLNQAIPPAWRSLDAFVVAAHDRGLNVLMQAPVVGGNAGAPPAWAGVREAGKSAPADMAAAAAFAGKLAQRYRPGGTLAQAQGWSRYGVRAWELDNEPATYKTHWQDQAGDYAELVTLAAAAIRAADPQAVIGAPAVAGGGGSIPWVDQSLDPLGMHGSPAYVAAGIPHSIGPSIDVVTFHVYEGVDDQSIDCALMDIRGVFEAHEDHPGFEYPRKAEYWHTEGNFDFLHLSPAETRMAWFPQMFTRAFAAGIRKVEVMDATVEERPAIAAYVATLPDPFPMVEAAGATRLIEGEARAYRHLDGAAPAQGQVWVLWAENDSSGAVMDVPVEQAAVTLISVDGSRQSLTAQDGWARVTLAGAPDASPPILLEDRPAGAASR